MTTLPSAVLTTSTLPTDDNPIPHSSLDDNNQPGDCDTLMKTNRSTDIDQRPREPTHCPLECDLHRLDLNDSLKSAENLKGEQSISLTTIPPDPSNPSSSPFNHHRLLVNYTDDHDDEQFCSFPSSTDYMAAAQPSSHCDRHSPIQDEQSIKPQPLIASNQTSVSQPIPSRSSAMSSESDSNTSVPYGVDWSDRARPTSHCWFPVTSNDLSTAQPCAYVSCTNLKPTHQSTLLHCGSCALVVHSHHLNDSQVAKADFLPPCRPSFIDNTTPGNSLLEGENNPSKYDQHFWSHVSVLPKPCMHCQRTWMASTLFGSGSGRLSMTSALDIMSSIPGNFSSKMSESSSGLVCLWCSQCYHRSCWERLAAQNDKIQCDYGICRNIIVRPQWLSRSSESPTDFRARLPSHSANKNSESNSFPYTPVLIFINKRSGGQIGEKIYRELLRKLNPRQVFLLENNDTITHALDIYSSLPNTRICVFGGDGTVGWVLGRLAEAYPSRNNPPVGICPLGTGNDLSRVLDWGEQYDPKRLFHTLVQIPQAQVVALDRWKVQLEQLDVSTLTSPERQNRESGFQIGRTFQPLFHQPPKFVRETNRDSYQKYHELPNTRFINYMSFGLDAAITLDFHDERTRDPSKFSSPLKNKLMYVNESCKHLKDFARANMWNLGSYIRLICDGHNMTDAIRDCHTLVVLNIPGYASGTNPWGKSSSTSSVDLFDSLAGARETYELITLNECSTEQTASSSTTTVSAGRFEQQDFGDRKIEVVGLSTTHMAAIHIGFRGNRITQCNQLRIELLCPMTAQMDGEPFYLPASVAVNISHAGQVLVLNNQNK